MMSPAVNFQSFELNTTEFRSLNLHSMGRQRDWEKDHTLPDITLSRMLTVLENQVQDEKNLETSYQRNKLSAVRTP